MNGIMSLSVSCMVSGLSSHLLNAFILLFLTCLLLIFPVYVVSGSFAVFSHRLRHDLISSVLEKYNW